MASRQEEKEARRQARLEQEQAERRTATRNKRLQLVFGAVLAVGLVVAVVLAVVASSGGDKETEAQTPSSSAAKIPVANITDLDAAAEEAGCTLASPKNEGNEHEEREFTPSDYQQNPPTSGTHFPEWAEDGIYEPANNPPLGELVHTLEHGRINVQYKPGTPEKTVKQLEALLGELDSGYHMLLYQNPTGMKAAVAATMWDQSLTCPEMNDGVFDAIRTFRQSYIDKGPEKVA